MAFKGTAFVTGAAQGIGLGIALRLADDGFDVAVNDVMQKGEALNGVVRQIRDKGRKGLGVLGDVSNEDDIKRMIAEVVRELDGLDVMVANAGIPLNKPLSDISVGEWDRLFAVNVRGTFLSFKYAAAQMVAQGRGGRILGACSTASKKGMPEAACYCSTKFAVRGLVQSAAQEYGKYGITVNAYAPGVIETPFLAQFDEYHARKNGTEKGQWTQGLRGLAATRRNGTPTDVAGLVSFLASADAGFITGAPSLLRSGNAALIPCTSRFKAKASSLMVVLCLIENPTNIVHFMMLPRCTVGAIVYYI